MFRFAASVFPSADDDVVTSPYNSVLSLRELVERADCVLPLENQQLADIAARVAARRDKAHPDGGGSGGGGGGGGGSRGGHSHGGGGSSARGGGGRQWLHAPVAAAARVRPTGGSALHASLGDPRGGKGAARGTGNGVGSRGGGGGDGGRSDGRRRGSPLFPDMAAASPLAAAPAPASPPAAAAAAAAAAGKPRGRKGEGFDGMNRIAARLLTHLTASMRFPGQLNTDVNEITTNLVRRAAGACV